MPQVLTFIKASIQQGGDIAVMAVQCLNAVANTGVSPTPDVLVELVVVAVHHVEKVGPVSPFSLDLFLFVSGKSFSVGSPYPSLGRCDRLLALYYERNPKSNNLPCSPRRTGANTLNLGSNRQVRQPRSRMFVQLKSWCYNFVPLGVEWHVNVLRQHYCEPGQYLFVLNRRC
jgi:hypothetical protein